MKLFRRIISTGTLKCGEYRIIRVGQSARPFPDDSLIIEFLHGLNALGEETWLRYHKEGEDIQENQIEVLLDAVNYLDATNFRRDEAITETEKSA